MSSLMSGLSVLTLAKYKQLLVLTFTRNIPAMETLGASADTSNIT